MDVGMMEGPAPRDVLSFKGQWLPCAAGRKSAPGGDISRSVIQELP